MPTILQPYVNLIAITDKAQELIEYCGRKCWKSEDKIEPGSAARFIKMLMNKKHISVIEHASATFEIITDRGISHEIVRHRIASFSQESTRYCNYSKTTGKMTGEIFVIKPSGMSEQESAEWWDAMLDSERHYLNLLKMGSTPQRARSVLPTCTKTDIAVTMNFRSWLHFIDLRAKSPPAHPDIAPIAQAIQKILIEKASAVFSQEQA